MSKETREFGDFQTPLPLAAAVCAILQQRGVVPSLILEPTCGSGSFLRAAAHAFPEARLIGVDLNSQHIAAASHYLSADLASGRATLFASNFFNFEWMDLLGSNPGPLLILGNPPWVTSSDLGALASENLPEKSNAFDFRGIEALTGKSNFDISEWMILRYLDWLQDRAGWIAVLIKSKVARRVLSQIWKRRYPIRDAAIYSLDAMLYFGVSVDACLFVLNVEPGAEPSACMVFDDLADAAPSRAIGFHDGFVVADSDTYLKWRNLIGRDKRFTWRSGVKHDCSKVMELTRENGVYRNGLGEVVDIEDALVFPLLKSSDLNGRISRRNRYLIITQRSIGEDTDSIRLRAPRTWEYLQRHANLFERRRSAIYRERPLFSIFGIGEYSFAPWKIAISGFYKTLHFSVIGPSDGRSTMFDDTVYFLACKSNSEADFLGELLNSRIAKEFYESMVFWSDKRPITSDLLGRLSIVSLARELRRGDELERFIASMDKPSRLESQLSLL